MENNNGLLGVDVYLNNGDLQVNQSGDLSWIAGFDNLEQALIHRIRTVIGSLIWHPEYGSNLELIVSRPNTKTLRSFIYTEILNTLINEPRIKNINKLLVLEFDSSTITIDIEVIPVNENNPRNLILRIKI